MCNMNSVRKNVADNNSGACWLVLFLVIALLAGCALKVKLVGEYDEITDKAVTDLHKKTASFFEKWKASSGADASYDANKKFYEDARGNVDF